MGEGEGRRKKKEAYLLLVQNVYSGPQTVAVVAWRDNCLQNTVSVWVRKNTIQARLSLNQFHSQLPYCREGGRERGVKFFPYPCQQMRSLQSNVCSPAVVTELPCSPCQKDDPSGEIEQLQFSNHFQAPPSFRVACNTEYVWTAKLCSNSHLIQQGSNSEACY